MSQHGVKLLLTGLSNTGKTTALRTLDPKKSLVISIDGKTFPFEIPHANYVNFPNIQGFIYGYSDAEGHVDGIVDKINRFKEAYGHFPETIVFDTVSRIFSVISDNCSTKFNGFEIHKNIAKEIFMFNEFVQNELVGAGINVVSITHVVLNADTNSYEDASSGSFKKTGGTISIHDHVTYFSVGANKKYNVSHRVPGLPCRTLLTKEQLPDSQNAEEYSLANHIAEIKKSTGEATKFVL